MSDLFIARDAVLAEFAGEDSILLDVDARRYHRLNETATFIWKSLEAEQPRGTILDQLVEAFDVERERADRSLDVFLSELAARGLVRESKPRD